MYVAFTCWDCGSPIAFAQLQTCTIASTWIDLGTKCFPAKFPSWSFNHKSFVAPIPYKRLASSPGRMTKFLDCRPLFPLQHQPPALSWWRLSRQPRRERLRIPRLHIKRPWPGEFTDQTFARADAGDDAARCDALERVLAVPGNEVAVVDDVAFAVRELWRERGFQHCDLDEED